MPVCICRTFADSSAAKFSLAKSYWRCYAQDPSKKQCAWKIISSAKVHGAYSEGRRLTKKERKHGEWKTGPSSVVHNRHAGVINVCFPLCLMQRLNIWAHPWNTHMPITKKTKSTLRAYKACKKPSRESTVGMTTSSRHVAASEQEDGWTARHRWDELIKNWREMDRKWSISCRLVCWFVRGATAKMRSGVRSVLARRISSFPSQARLIRAPVVARNVFPPARAVMASMPARYPVHFNHREFCSVVANNPVETAGVLQEVPSRKFWHDTFHELTAISDDPRHTEGQEKAVRMNKPFYCAAQWVVG